MSDLPEIITDPTPSEKKAAPLAFSVSRRKALGSLAGLAGASVFSGLQFSPTLALAKDEQKESFSTILVRKNVKNLTPEDLGDIVGAIKQLKKMPSPFSPGLSYYDNLVIWHRDIHRCGYMGHMGPNFFPWHRAYLLAFEQALRLAASKPIAVPYWDWTDPESTSAVFTDDFMGPLSGRPEDDYTITSGPFRKGEWNIIVHGPPSDDPAQFTYLVRAAGTASLATQLPTAQDLAEALRINTYDVPPYDLSSDPGRSFRQAFEGWIGFGGMGVCVDDILQPTTEGSQTEPAITNHNKVHFYLGGIFKPSDQVHIYGEGYFASLIGLKGAAYGTIVPATAPNDPVFWLLHSNVDRVWVAWQAKHPNAYQPAQNGPNGQNLDDTIPFFQGVLNTYTIRSVQDICQLGYTYDQFPAIPWPEP